MYKTAGLVLAGVLCCSPLYAQYVDLPGNNQAIQEYVDEAPENANTSIMYIFYSNWDCEGCAEAVRLIYYLYQKYYINDFNIFEINYMADADYNYRLDYDLTQPLSVVLVRMRSGQALGYYKIDNPQRLLYNDFDFEENILSQINNFLAM